MFGRGQEEAVVVIYLEEGMWGEVLEVYHLFMCGSRSKGIINN